MIFGISKFLIGQTIGYASSVLNTVLFIPQVYQVIRTKDTHAINICYLRMEIIGSILSITYAIFIVQIPLFISSFSILICTLCIYYVKLFHKPIKKISISPTSGRSSLQSPLMT